MACASIAALGDLLSVDGAEQALESSLDRQLLPPLLTATCATKEATRDAARALLAKVRGSFAPPSMLAALAKVLEHAIGRDAGGRLRLGAFAFAPHLIPGCATYLAAVPRLRPLVARAVEVLLPVELLRDASAGAYGHDGAVGGGLLGLGLHVKAEHHPRAHGTLETELRNAASRMFCELYRANPEGVADIVAAADPRAAAALNERLRHELPELAAHLHSLPPQPANVAAMPPSPPPPPPPPLQDQRCSPGTREFQRLPLSQVRRAAPRQRAWPAVLE